MKCGTFLFNAFGVLACDLGSQTGFWLRLSLRVTFLFNPKGGKSFSTPRIPLGASSLSGRVEIAV